jgi:hypothetical protein
LQKEEFSAAFQKMYDRAKASLSLSLSLYIYIYIYIYANRAYFELKKVICLPHVSAIFKNSVLKLLDRTVYAQKNSFVLTMYLKLKFIILEDFVASNMPIFLFVYKGWNPDLLRQRLATARNAQNELAICDGGGPSSAFLFQRT